MQQLVETLNREQNNSVTELIQVVRNKHEDLEQIKINIENIGQLYTNRKEEKVSLVEKDLLETEGLRIATAIQDEIKSDFDRFAVSTSQAKHDIAEIQSIMEKEIAEKILLQNEFAAQHETHQDLLKISTEEIQSKIDIKSKLENQTALLKSVVLTTKNMIEQVEVRNNWLVYSSLHHYQNDIQHSLGRIEETEMKIAESGVQSDYEENAILAKTEKEISESWSIMALNEKRVKQLSEQVRYDRILENRLTEVRSINYCEQTWKLQMNGLPN